MKLLGNIATQDFTAWGKSFPTHCHVLRDEYLLRICEGKCVLHVGAADAPFHVSKAQAGTLLHQKISGCAESCVGIDTDADAVQSLRAFGIENILIGEINGQPKLNDRTFDIILCCDVIEHVNAPFELLESCAAFMRDDSLLLISTINATACKPAIRALLGKEAVHPDHVAYYSMSTLAKLAIRAGLEPLEFASFNYLARNYLLGRTMDWISRRRPGISDGIIITTRKSPK